jgi:hypothetical protein
MIISGEERLQCGDGTVSVKGFVLPHKDRLSARDFQIAAGPRGWHGQQGFYVYRNMRLLVSGGWLGLEQLTSEEHYKLARIRVDIPSSLDGEWAIDVKKSRAQPPGKLRQRLRELAVAVRSRARNVYVHRGRESSGGASEPLRRVWLSNERDGRICTGSIARIAGRSALASVGAASRRRGNARLRPPFLCSRSGSTRWSALMSTVPRSKVKIRRTSAR